jgi:prevent-host-death family protein
MMEKVISATEARVHFGELMRRVTEHNEPVIVERGGKPEVVVISFAEYERLCANHADNWLERVDKVREQIRRELGGRTLPPPEDVIREMREERDAQLLDNLR